MLRAPADTFDYVLHVTSDDRHFARVHCHKAVLRCHSARFSALMTGANYAELEVKLAPGFLGAFLELVQYMYLRDVTLISHPQKVMRLCAQFDMPTEIFFIREKAVAPRNTYPTVTFTLVSDPATGGGLAHCVVAQDFLQHLEFYQAKLCVTRPPSASVSVEVQTDPEPTFSSLTGSDSAEEDTPKAKISAPSSCSESTQTEPGETASTATPLAACVPRPPLRRKRILPAAWTPLRLRLRRHPR